MLNKINLNFYITIKIIKNTLKIIIPLNESEDYNGGIKILDLHQTKKIENGIKINSKSLMKYLMLLVY